MLREGRALRPSAEQLWACEHLGLSCHLQQLSGLWHSPVNLHNPSDWEVHASDSTCPAFSNAGAFDSSKTRKCRWREAWSLLLFRSYSKPDCISAFTGRLLPVPVVLSFQLTGISKSLVKTLSRRHFSVDTSGAYQPWKSPA